MVNRIKIIATIGPASNKPEILRKLKDRDVSYFRINLSHTDEKDIAKIIRDLKPYNVPIILDTEGYQIRSGNTSEIDFLEGETVRLFKKKII